MLFNRPSSLLDVRLQSLRIPSSSFPSASSSFPLRSTATTYSNPSVSDFTEFGCRVESRVIEKKGIGLVTTEYAFEDELLATFPLSNALSCSRARNALSAIHPSFHDFASSSSAQHGALCFMNRLKHVKERRKMSRRRSHLSAIPPYFIHLLPISDTHMSLTPVSPRSHRGPDPLRPHHIRQSHEPIPASLATTPPLGLLPSRPLRRLLLLLSPPHRRRHPRHLSPRPRTSHGRPPNPLVSRRPAAPLPHRLVSSGLRRLEPSLCPPGLRGAFPHSGGGLCEPRCSAERVCAVCRFGGGFPGPCGARGGGGRGGGCGGPAAQYGQCPGATGALIIFLFLFLFLFYILFIYLFFF